MHFIIVNGRDRKINGLGNIFILQVDITCFVKVYQKVLGVQEVLGFQSLVDLLGYKIETISNR